MQISSKILPHIANFVSFSPSENEALSAAYIRVTAVNLFYEVCQNSSKLLASTFLKEKHETASEILGILRLQRNLPPKMPFFVCQKVQISPKP